MTRHFLNAANISKIIKNKNKNRIACIFHLWANRKVHSTLTNQEKSIKSDKINQTKINQ